MPDSWRNALNAYLYPINIQYLECNLDGVTTAYGVELNESNIYVTGGDLGRPFLLTISNFRDLNDIERFLLILDEATIYTIIHFFSGVEDCEKYSSPIGNAIPLKLY